MMDITITYAINGNPEEEDRALAASIQEALGEPFETHLIKVVNVVRGSIGGRVGSHLNVRCFRTDKPKTGFCLKHGGGIVPHIILGFTGDIGDFTITLIHELLHLFRWDERMVERKAKEIYHINGLAGVVKAEMPTLK